MEENGKKPRRRIIIGAVVVAGVLLLAYFGFFGRTPSPSQEATSAGIGAASVVQSPTATSGAEATPRAGATATVTGTANLEVSPAEVATGKVVFTLSVQQAQPAYDPARVTAAPAANSDQKAPAQPKGFAVLGGSTLKVTNNFDQSQSPPADQPLEMLRHVAVQIKEKDSGQIVPNVTATMDLLRDGRPVLQDQPLVPMVPAGEGVGQMQYGNNVKIPGKGDYQVFVRMEPSPLLGSDSGGVVQFNLSVK